MSRHAYMCSRSTGAAHQQERDVMDIKQEEITTLHGLTRDEASLLDSVRAAAEERPVSVVLPMLYQELQNDALDTIVSELNACDFLKEVIVSLSADSQEQFEEVKQFFSRLDVPNMVMWCNGPEIQELLEELRGEGLDYVTAPGKGRDVWLAFGIATLRSYAIVVHDADIKSYTRMYPAKLAFPLLDPELDFKFNKGYYARVNLEERQLYGRVFRLFLNPLLQALTEETKAESDFIRFLRSFRYPLSGEFALTSDIALDLDIPSDWGLEVGILAEVYRNITRKRICQTDLGFYDHKHQQIGDPSEGLIKMSRDIFKTLLRALIETDHIQISETFLTSLQVVYQRRAQDCIRQYNADAQLNGLNFDRHMEETLAERFSDNLLDAGTAYLKKPVGTRLPDWLRAMSAKKKIRNRLLDIVLDQNDL